MGNNVTATFPNAQCNYLLQVVVTDPATGCSSTATYPINWCCSFNTITPEPQNVFTLLNTSISANPFSEDIQSLPQQNPPLIKKVHVAGTLDIDVNTTWIGVEVTMYPGAEIIVRPGVRFTLRQDVFEPCETFWKSITVMNNATLILRTCTIQGGQYAINVLDGGSYLISDFNEFDDCFTSIRVNGPTSGQGLLRVIDRTTIGLSTISPGNFYNQIFDYNGQVPVTAAPGNACDEIPWAGIEFINTGFTNIGRSPLSSANLEKIVISDAVFGIRTINSSPVVTNVEIDRIQNSPCGGGNDITGSGIYAEGGMFNFIRAINDVKITNARRGIRTKGLTVVVDDVEIFEVEDAIHIEDPSPSFVGSVILNNNKICFRNQGVRLYSQSSNFNAGISLNEINECTSSVLAPSAITTGAIIANTLLPNNGTSIQVWNNQISLLNQKRGISLIDVSASAVEGNTIGLNSTIASQIGLRFQGVSDLICRENNVIGTPAPYPAGRVGLRAINNTVQNNNSVEYICNYLQNTDVGVEFSSHNSSVIIDRTKIENANRGMVNIASGLGSQVDRFNQWCGSFGTSAYNSTPFSQLILETPLSGPGNGCEFNPLNLITSSAGAFQVFPSNNTSVPNCINYLRSDTITLTDFDQFVIDSLDNYNLGEVTLWQLKRNLMQKLQRHQQLLSLNESALNFWNEYISDEIGLLSSYKVRFDSLSFYTNEQLESAIGLKEAITGIEDQVQWIDSILETRPESEDSVLYLLERDSLNELYNEMVFESDSLWHVGWEQSMEIVNELAAELGTMSLSSDLGEKERLYYTLAIKLGPWNVNQSFTSADTALLIELAHLCELEYGHPVTWSRGVYANWFDEEVEDSEACGGGLRLKKDKELLDPASFVSIQPNPATDQVLVKWQSFDIESTHSLRIYTINGTFVKEVQITGSESYHDINELENSIYLIEVVKDNNIVYRLKLAIVK